MPESSPALRLAITTQALAHGGGAERYTRDIVAGLIEQGIRPLVIARRVDTSLPLARQTAYVALRLRGVPRLWRSAAFDWQAGRALQRQTIDCVFGINQTLHAQVAVCGGTHPGFLQAMAKRPGWADRRQIELERRCYAHARYIVAHSRRMREELLRYYDLPADKIDVLYPPVDASRFKPLDAQQRLLTRARLGLPADRVVFLLVSTGHARKGWAELQAVFAQTRLPITLAVAGRPLPHAAANVVELGYRADIETVFAAADFTVVASRYEPFGLVAVESVLCGTPVVIADTVGSAEVLGENAKIGYSLQTPDGLSAAIAAAYRRAQQGQHRIDAPRSALRYDPGVKTHVDALLLRFAACAQS